jgi:hypothetical protein
VITALIDPSGGYDSCNEGGVGFRDGGGGYFKGFGGWGAGSVVGDYSVVAMAAMTVNASVADPECLSTLGQECWQVQKNVFLVDTEKDLRQFTRNLTQNFLLSSQKGWVGYGTGSRIQKNLIPDPDPEVKKAPIPDLDPGVKKASYPGSWICNTIGECKLQIIAIYQCVPFKKLSCNKILTINVLLVLVVREVFHMRAKHLIGDFEGFSRGRRPPNCPDAAKGNLGVRFLFRDGQGCGFNPRQSNITWKMKVRRFTMLRILNHPWAI